ncbi:trimeric intracellular cation channel family protein [Luteolibacter yonseiensis]|uniref:Trimeric intracellular cation channel family protein n=1 Tax=Luteolibacter yonseiensis TaxID=1144680 RepID=A0A934VD37_9BACT|nr:trimeric intracellular cation channel family protein [Luteolibacter yonseiensis]MBK1817626.1 trimeric intracellular cation channel family protein [Luteolibacter yonseiensis]
MLEVAMLSTFLDHFGVSVSALSGVLAAREKGLDLFGVLVLAVVTALGGGSVRDMLAGDGAVAWLLAPGIFYTVCTVALVAFFICRWWEPPQTLFQVADALALCFFAVAGTRKGMGLGFAPPVCIALGVITGVAGGILRDTLLGRVPLVFQKHTYFYATAAFFGGLIYTLLRGPLGDHLAIWISISSAILLRLGAIRYRISLPSFTLKSNNDESLG